MSLNHKPLETAPIDDYFARVRDENQPRLRICFDPEQEIPLLQKWFAINNHPSRSEVIILLNRNTQNKISTPLQVEHYTTLLNSAPGRVGRPKLDIHNIIYWFKNTRAALRRAEIRKIRSSTFEMENFRSNNRND